MSAGTTFSAHCQERHSVSQGSLFTVRVSSLNRSTPDAHNLHHHFDRARRTALRGATHSDPLGRRPRALRDLESVSTMTSAFPNPVEPGVPDKRHRLTLSRLTAALALVVV